MRNEEAFSRFKRPKHGHGLPELLESKWEWDLESTWPSWWMDIHYWFHNWHSSSELLLEYFTSIIKGLLKQATTQISITSKEQRSLEVSAISNCIWQWIFYKMINQLIQIDGFWKDNKQRRLEVSAISNCIWQWKVYKMI